MNNPFHRAALKAFSETIVECVADGCAPAYLEEVVRELTVRFEARLEAQARAFDACKTGTEISMKTLHHEMGKALAAYRKRVRLDGDHSAAERDFNQHMQPHFEIRLW